MTIVIVGSHKDSAQRSITGQIPGCISGKHIDFTGLKSGERRCGAGTGENGQIWGSLVESLVIHKVKFAGQTEENGL